MSDDQMVPQDSDEVSIQVVEDMSVLGDLTRAEVDMQVATAQKYPRSIQRVKEQMYTLATLDQETAQSMYYILPRGKKKIEGPSVRLAEIVAQCWGNCRAEGRIVDEGRKFVTGQGVAWDLEKNWAVRVEVRRRITDKKGKRYNDDMVQVTGNAAVSIALRNAILRMVPAALWRQAFKGALRTAIGEQDTLESIRERWVNYFIEAGVDAEDIYRTLGVQGMEDIGATQVRVLIGVKNAIEEGDTDLETAFADRGPTGPSEAARDLNAEIKKSEEEIPPEVQEAWRRAQRVAEKLADRGHLHIIESEEIDRLRAAHDLEGLIQIHEKLRKRLEEISDE